METVTRLIYKNFLFLFLFPNRECRGSYPTYEEWKKFLKIFQLSYPTRNNGSYPTYEEWKPTIQTSRAVFKQREPSSYPTYEEWKLTTT
jgi:hypothetical protein